MDILCLTLLVIELGTSRVGKTLSNLTIRPSLCITSVVRALSVVLVLNSQQKHVRVLYIHGGCGCS